MPELLNLAAHNGSDPAEPEDEGERDEWLRGDQELAAKKKERLQERSEKVQAFLTGQDDDERTSKPDRVSTSQPPKQSESQS